MRASTAESGSSRGGGRATGIERRREGEALLLPAAQRHAALADLGLQT